MHPQRDIIEAAIRVQEAIETPQQFKVKKTPDGRLYSFEKGGSVSVSIDDDDHHTVSIDHDHPSSIRAALDHHISNTPGGPTSMSTTNPDHNKIIRSALTTSEYDWKVDSNKPKGKPKKFIVVPTQGASKPVDWTPWTPMSMTHNRSVKSSLKKKKEEY